MSATEDVDPRLAATWAASIDDTIDRRVWSERVIERWREKDAAAADAWLANH